MAGGMRVLEAARRQDAEADAEVAKVDGLRKSIQSAVDLIGAMDQIDPSGLRAAIQEAGARPLRSSLCVSTKHSSV